MYQTPYAGFIHNAMAFWGEGVSVAYSHGSFSRTSGRLQRPTSKVSCKRVAEAMMIGGYDNGSGTIKTDALGW